MLNTHFDTWTRRRFGRTAAGTLSALVSIFGRSSGATAKKNKHRRKQRRKHRPKQHQRCLDLHQRCRSDEAQQSCCAGLTCDQTVTLDGLSRRCCRQPQNICADVSDCCYPASCDAVAGLTGRHCCREYQTSCSSDAECCRALRCAPSAVQAGNHCCAAAGSPCREHADCCADAGGFCNILTAQCERVS